MAKVRFDDSLQILTRVIASELGAETLVNGTALRDSRGQLTFFCSYELDEPIKAQTSSKLRDALGPYARADRVLAGSSDFGASDILGEVQKLFVEISGFNVRLVDRRIVGADWLRQPVIAASGPPRFVFASLKGGVGRSTALAIAAADFARRAKRVLAIDLDMEAPGLGAILLDADTLPEFGMIDALVENNFDKLDHQFFEDMIGPSALTDRNGKIDVIPALGSRSLKNPGDILSKLSRAYAEDLDSSGDVLSIMDQVSLVIREVADPLKYDVVLIDARSGLNESTAAAILGLGAEVLLFGLNDSQTFQGYRALFSHLARFVSPGGSLPEWVNRLTIVQAKAPTDPTSRAYFTERAEELFSEAGLGRSRIFEDSSHVLLPAAPFDDVPWTDDSEIDDRFDDVGSVNQSIAILDDDRFREFAPLQSRDLITNNIYEASYRSFIDYLDQAFPREVKETMNDA